jgi:hypothetical protein
MSIVCVIWSWQSCDPAVHIGVTSIDILCQLASKSLWPSSRLEIPAFPLHGNNFKNGVKFSVQTTSLGNVPCNRCRFESVELAWPTAGWKDITGLVVLVESMKFSEAQKRPDSAFVNVNHLPSALPLLAQSSMHNNRHTLHQSPPQPKPTAPRRSLPPSIHPTA